MDVPLLVDPPRARDHVPLHFSTTGALHAAFTLRAGFGHDLIHSTGSGA
ncbi:MAG: hypothetical protein AVDCRST_MAG27-424 [uncultured Craurococcus sp.]|uniref:Uncharacterized protein n=1 Tax=uncultured Craurococcus sp. TaxID=1135998 RepID=A0A6J4HEM6_9PROT|nr:MAG: hypothetical protein AVDCRST_MAG27-424 [uncultured Craurococcus sp.]